MLLVRGYCSSTLWEGKSQSIHQDFKCDHYKTGKTGRKTVKVFYILQTGLYSEIVLGN